MLIVLAYIVILLVILVIGVSICGFIIPNVVAFIFDVSKGHPRMPIPMIISLVIYVIAVFM